MALGGPILIAPGPVQALAWHGEWWSLAMSAVTTQSVFDYCDEDRCTTDNHSIVVPRF